ncbi:MAG: hypothetical protein HRU19_16690 [Pseudobacteriovorax sp.]|nr:hypothetical protein [Pseudobacteriovorax sp.]
MNQVHCKKSPWILLFALAALLGPNGLYLYSVLSFPEMNAAAWSNPVALAFIIEAFMLLGLFLLYVYRRTRSYAQVGLYFLLSCLGSLAFSFPIFIFLNGIELVEKGEIS